MTKSWLYPAFLLAFLTPCQARLGETLEQINARFGQPFHSGRPNEPDYPNLTLVGELQNDYQKGGIDVRVVFLNGIAQAEDLINKDGSDFDADEINKFLQIESAGQKWQQDRNRSDFKHWIREDGAYASYTQSKKQLSFGTEAFLKAFYAANPSIKHDPIKRAEPDKGEGF